MEININTPACSSESIIYAIEFSIQKANFHK